MANIINLRATIKKNDPRAKLLIWLVSVIIFVCIAALGRIKLDINLGFNPHLFATANAIINGTVSILLIAGLIAIKQRRYIVHKRIMFTALVLSIMFLISYVCHHLFTGDTRFGGDGVIRYVYFVILVTHILLAAIILPFILFTSYRALTAEWTRHRKLAKVTWPIWLYVSITGVVVYLMISPYYI